MGGVGGKGAVAGSTTDAGDTEPGVVTGPTTGEPRGSSTRATLAMCADVCGAEEGRLQSPAEGPMSHGPKAATDESHHECEK